MEMMPRPLVGHVVYIRAPAPATMSPIGLQVAIDFALKPADIPLVSNAVVLEGLENYREFPPPLSEELKQHVRSLIPAGWAAIEENVVFNPKRPPPQNLCVRVPDTRWRFYIQAPCLPGHFCNVMQMYADEDGETWAWVHEPCETPAKLKDILEGAPVRIQVWEENTMGALLVQGFNIGDSSRCMTKLDDGITLRVTPTLFPGSIALLKRLVPKGVTPKEVVAPVSCGKAAVGFVKRLVFGKPAPIAVPRPGLPDEFVAKSYQTLFSAISRMRGDPWVDVY